MGSKSTRLTLPDGSFIESLVQSVKPDQWSPHGVRYRLAWIQKGKCRVLFDNHHGKTDHYHVDDVEKQYVFTTVEKLWVDFRKEIELLGGM